MPTFTIPAPGSYEVWAAPEATGGPVKIIVASGHGTPDTTVYWSPSAPALPDMPSDGRATRGIVHVDSAGAAVFTQPDRARLIVRQVALNAVVYDSGPLDEPPPQSRSLPAPRSGPVAADGEH